MSSKKTSLSCAASTADPGLSLTFKNHALPYAHKTSQGPEDAGIADCVYGHLLTIKAEAHKRSTLV